MKKTEKIPLAVIYDKQTGRIILTHRIVLLNNRRESAREELIAEAEKIAVEGKLPLPTEHISVLLEINREEIGNLIAIDQTTQQPKFWDIRSQGMSKKNQYPDFRVSGTLSLANNPSDRKERKLMKY